MTWEIIHGDCLEVMKSYPDNYFSCVCTDPPYGLSFMGKGWDHEVPGKEYWRECLRITKPGGYLLAMGGSRTSHRLATAIEESGYEIRDTIMWIYGSGFPKSHNHFGIEGFGTALKPAYEPIIMAMKPLEGTFKQNAEKWGQAGINIDGCRIKGESWGSRPKIKLTSKGKKGGGFGQTKWETLPGENKDSGKGRWPANIILDEEAGRLLDRTTGAQVSRFFFIARNDTIDPCQSQEESSLSGKKTESESNNPNIGMFGKKPMGLFQPDTISIIETETHSIMSFPILSVSKHKLIGICTLECEKSIQKSEILNIESVSIAENGVCYLHFQNEAMEPIRAIVKNVPVNAWLSGENPIENIGTNIIGKEDDQRAMSTTKNIAAKIETGSTLKDEIVTQRRFFYCAKSSTRERNEGLDGLPNKSIRPETRDSGSHDIFNTEGCGRNTDNKPVKNHHPTVKPLSLMRYLITLISPPQNALILDPFAGSGTTILAAKHLGISAVGIEKIEEYVTIARARLESCML